MSVLRLEQLLAFDAVPWDAAAGVWLRLAQDIDAAAGQLIRGTRELSEAWPSGTASEAAHNHTMRLRTEMDNTHSPAKALGVAFNEHAYAMRGLRNQAEMILTSARQAGYTVDIAAATITAPPASHPSAALDRRDSEIGGMLRDLQMILVYAQQQDARTTSVIRTNMPTARRGFGPVPPGATLRAENLMAKLKDPTYQPPVAELTELRTLLTRYGKDEVFAHTLLTNLGPEGLLRLSGTLATYQVDTPGRDTYLFNRETAELVGDLQRGLGTMLSTATQQTGTPTDPSDRTYLRGEYELSDEWLAGLMAAGRSTMDIGDPSSPGRYVEDVYGYQLLGPLLHGEGYDAKFLSTVGGDMIDFEIEQDKGSALWTEARSDNIRLDWTHGHDDNQTPAGYDPVNALMGALQHNGEATRDLLTNSINYTPDGPAGGRWPRLDYLLTDRDWDPTADIPGGAEWTAEVLKNGDDYKSDALDKFGTALERATTDEPGPEARRLIEGIIYELNVDEQAAGFKNLEAPNSDGKVGSFTQTNLIQPQLRDSMANIMSEYIVEVNYNIREDRVPEPPDEPRSPESSIGVKRDHLIHFLADIGKDEGARETVASAEMRYASEKYAEIYANGDPLDETKKEKLANISKDYGSVIGAIDFGAGRAEYAESNEKDSAANDKSEKKYNIIGVVAETGLGKVPYVGDFANAVSGVGLDALAEAEKVDNQRLAASEVAALTNSSRNTAELLAESALYNSGELRDLPKLLLEDGQPKPMSTWERADSEAWERYKEGDEGSTVISAKRVAGEDYHTGLGLAETVLPKTKGDKS